MKANLKYYFSIFLRRLHWFLAVAIVISALAIGVAMTLPPAYVSQARFVVEGSQIPDALAPPTAASGGLEQLQIIEQRLLARGNLLDIARRLEPLPEQGAMSPDQIVSAMNSATTISMQGGGRTGGALQMMIKFQAASADKAAAVVNEYLTQVQRADVDTRVGQAGQTMDFFQQEVESLGTAMSDQSAKVLAFKNQNSDALPEGQTFRLNQQSLLQERLAQTERDIATLAQQRQRMIDIYEATGQISSMGGDTRSPEQRELDELRSELNRALVVYAPGNPRIRVLEARIKQMEAVVANLAANDPSARPGATPLDLQLAEMDTRTELLEEQRTQIEAQLTALNDAIGRTSANGIALSALERDFSNLQTQYNAATQRLASASTGERVELLSRGRRISVIEQPVAPSAPTKPNRVLIAGGGTFFGILAGLALIVLLELLNRSPRKPEDLVKKLGIMPLATIPYMKPVKTAPAVPRAAMKTAMILALMIGLGAAAGVIHTQYQPLDQLAQEAFLMERLQAAIEKARAQRNESGPPPAPTPRSAAAVAAAVPGYSDRSTLDANWQSFRQIDTTVPAFRDKKIAAFAGGAEAAAFDMLRTRVIQQARSNNWRRIAVVSPHSGCGKTTTVTNLAFSLGRNSDMRTLAIDFDLRRATLARMLNQKPEHTMAEVLESRISFADHGLRYGNSVAFGLNSGPVQNSSELLQSNRTAAVLDEIDATFQPDIVLFDMPPLLATDDSFAFLKNVDCALLIVAAEETPMNQIDVAERQIAELTQVMGVVLNKCRQMGSAYGYEYNY